MVWTNPRTWVAGEKPSAATLNTHIRDNLKALGDPWTAYTPVWTAVTTNPTLGNGTLTGSFMQVGKLVHFRIRVTFGSTTTVGSGQYTWTLPANIIATHIAVALVQVRNSAGTARHVRFARANAVNTIVAEDTAGVALTHAAPLAWATGDTIDIHGSYEAA